MNIPDQSITEPDYKPYLCDCVTCGEPFDRNEIISINIVDCIPCQIKKDASMRFYDATNDEEVVEHFEEKV